MVQTKMQIVDSDAHVIESERTWDYIRQEELRYRPTGITIDADGEAGRPRRDAWVVDGAIKGFRFSLLNDEQLDARSKLLGRDQRTAQEAREMGDIDARLRHMDMLGIDVQVLHSTIFISEVTDKPEIDVAICRSWNRWLADIYKQAHGRLRWVCTPPLLNIKDSIDELRFAKENGAVGVLIRPYETNNRLMTDPYFYPVLEEAQRLDMPIATHIANANSWYNEFITKQIPNDGGAFARFFIPAAIACHALVLSPISETFPKLRWGIIEAGSSWVPWVVRDLRERFKRRGEELPADIFAQRNIYITCENDDDIPYILEHAGEDCLMIGTDYGHTDASSDVGALRVLQERTDISASARQKILSENAKRFYAL